MQVKKKTKRFFIGRKILFSDHKNVRVGIARIKLAIVKLDVSQAAPAIFV